jgi:hypothetical protein
VTASGTEPGDFVDLDMDAMTVDRRLRLVALVRNNQGRLEAQLGSPLQVVSAGDDVELHDRDGLRFTATLSADGRLVLTDERLGDRL